MATMDLEGMQREIDEHDRITAIRDAKAGYCLVYPAKVSAPFADEVLKRTATKANPFLLKYAQMILATGDWPEVVDKTKIIDWYDNLQAVFPSKSSAVASLTFRYLTIFGRILSNSQHTEDPMFCAEWIDAALKEIKIGRHLHDGFTDPTPEDYKYDYDTLLAKTKEVQKLWEQGQRKHASID